MEHKQPPREPGGDDAAYEARCGRSEDRDTFATVGYGKHVKFWELQQPDEALDEYQAESANAVWDQDNNPVTDSWRAVYLGWPSRVLLTAGENGLVYAWFDKKCVASFRAHASVSGGFTQTTTTWHPLTHSISAAVSKSAPFGTNTYMLHDVPKGGAHS